MDITITPGKLHGTVTAIPSKSQAHRMLICAAFADKETILHCPESNRDIDATAQCLNALGAEITRLPDGFSVKPVQEIPESAVLPCQDSGSTLRFLLPVAGALGCNATFLMTGRLPQRPLSPMWEELERMGCTADPAHGGHHPLHRAAAPRCLPYQRRGFQPVYHRSAAGLCR